MSSTAIVIPHSNFGFDSHVAFRQDVKAAIATKAKQIIIEMSEVEYMDSSALGMLLLAKRDADEIGSEIIINKPHGFILKILKTVYFDKQFKIVE